MNPICESQNVCNVLGDIFPSHIIEGSLAMLSEQHTSYHFAWVTLHVLLEKHNRGWIYDISCKIYTEEKKMCDMQILQFIIFPCFEFQHIRFLYPS